MAIVYRCPDAGGIHYASANLPSYDISSSDIGMVNEMRVRAYGDWQEMLALQKQCGALARDSEDMRLSVRGIKPIADLFRKEYKAACYILGWLDPDLYGDCPWVELKDWPSELFDFFDPILNALYLTPTQAILKG